MRSSVSHLTQAIPVFVALTPQDAEKLKTLARRPKTSQAMALRARIVPACASGLNNTWVAVKFEVSKPAADKWRERFRLHRLDELPLEIHLVLDNYGTHKAPKGRGRLARHPRFRVHFTLTGASRLKLVERLFAEVTERCVRRAATGRRV